MPADCSHPSRTHPLPSASMIFTYLTLLSLFLYIVFVSGCLPDERSALLQLKKGFYFSKLECWQPNTNCCQWGGVLCNGDSGNVVHLDLSSQNISGSINSSLFNLTSLRVLNLAFNLFYGNPIPSSGWEKLENLTHLNISNSGFQGQVPIGISRLNNLVSLDLSSYAYAGMFPLLELRDPDLGGLLQGLSNLRVLYLDGVNISASGDEWCGALAQSTPELQELSLEACLLSDGPIPHQLGNLTQLESLDLSKNHLSGEIPLELASLTFLSALNLSYNNLVGKIPEGGQFSTFSNTSFEGNDGLCRLHCTTSVPTTNNISISPPTLDDIENKSYMIILGILFGVGFGGAMAIIVVVDVMCCDRSNRRRSMVASL